MTGHRLLTVFLSLRAIMLIGSAGALVGSLLMFLQGGFFLHEAWHTIMTEGDAVQKQVTVPVLESRLGVLAQWQLEDGRYVPVALGPNLGVNRGVRREGKDLQMGLTRSEIQAVHRLLTRLLERVDAGEITVVAVPNPGTQE